ncbi:hypothetical protein HG536_0F01560 [Torulaspora globosa]|uniref:DNA 3'-5' helicase n=1 Tax=Torulaspora globosa TaxID=48254 RepID=A0A7G3ZJZ5_9SACH|nr:uncharacterized protein HG536_0F01560 [Torulaspora globosa]QLL33831.1 hypothetical protein HG536_0F01560 [Torulaspora globosa]
MESNAVLKEILSSLNRQQRVAVQFDHAKALQVIAGPGTGKTKVLTSRVAYLLLHHRIKPQDIIVTTFTNKAAKEMIERLSKMLQGSGIRVSDIMIGTFHSVCLKILSRFGHKIGLRKDWRIVDESEIDKIMQEMIEKMPDSIRDQANSMARKVNLCLPKKGTDEWAVHPKAVKKQISRLKAFAVIPEEYQKDNHHDQALAYFYEKYQAELSKLNALDFDDLLMYAFRLLTTERCLPYMQHVLVDEFQDTNGIQMDLMFLFAKGNHHLSRGITVVGDPDQSIYAFRHALAQNFEAMANKCPIECSRVILIENYRSSQKILDTSETLIKQQSRGRADRLPLRAQFDCEFAPVYIDFPAAFLEGPSLIREMLYLKALPNLFTFNDFAILVRQRRQIKSIETALIEHGIPYKIIRGHAFWELKEVVSMLNLLKCVFFDNERHTMLSVLQYPARGLGAASAGKIKAILDDYQGTAFHGLKKISENTLKIGIPAKAMQVVKDFIAMINYCQTLSKNPNSTTLNDIFEKLYEGSGMRHEYLYNDGKKKSEIQGDEDPNYSNPRHKNVMILKSYFTGNGMSKSFEATTEAKSPQELLKTRSDNTGSQANTVKNHIRDFFLSLSLFSTETSDAGMGKKDEQEKNGFVTISTIHGAKGLEWPVVFIPGCEEGIIPSIFGDEKAQENDEDEDEDQDQESVAGSESSRIEQPVSPRKAQSFTTDSSLDEERRMFFVAQTRAKHLLYHSAATGGGRSEGSPSRFLTTDLLGTMTDHQGLFDSVEVIKKFYVNLGREPPMESRQFQLTRLVQDYAKFIENRRERFVWNGDFVVNMFKFDITKNVQAGYSTSFTTAAAQLQYSNGPSSDKYSNEGTAEGKTVRTSPKNSSSNRNTAAKSPKRAYAPPLKDKGDIRLISPTKNIAPVSPTGSPAKKRSYAPTYRPSRNAPNALACKRKLFAPTQEKVQLKMEKSLSSRDLEDSFDERASASEKSFSPANKFGSKSSSNLKEENESKAMMTESLSRKSEIGRRSKRMLYATPIDISGQNTSNKIDQSKETPNSSYFSGEDSLNTTAAELLHNPNDVLVDTRPIIASAKTLADAARKPTKSRESRDTGSSNKVKLESSSSQCDIFSQLSRAKKKTKLSDGEIIIID